MSLSRLLRLPDVEAVTGLGKDSIYRLGREGKFPRPVKLNERASAWKEEEIKEWIDSRPRVSRASSAPPRRRAARRRP